MEQHRVVQEEKVEAKKEDQQKMRLDEIAFKVNCIIRMVGERLVQRDDHSVFELKMKDPQVFTTEDEVRFKSLSEDDLFDLSRPDLQLDHCEFTVEFITKMYDINMEDRKTIVGYILENRDCKSVLVIGWEVTERLYQNERNRSFFEKRLFGKVMYISCIPIEIISFFVLMPRYDPKSHNQSKIRLLFNPIVGSYFFSYILTHGLELRHSYFKLVFFILFSISAIIVYPVVFRESPPRGVFFSFTIINNVSVALLTFYSISNLIMDLFRSLNTIFNFSYSFLAVSIFSNVVWIPAIDGARKTTKYTHTVPGYNGAIFNTLLVFGLCSIIHATLRGEISSKMWPITSNREADLATFFFVYNSLILPITFLMIRRNGYKYTKTIGKVLTTMYYFTSVTVFFIEFFRVI